jgi:hypothetical protein
MSTFFVKFQVIPAEINPQYALVEGAFAFCWVVEDSALAAYNKACFYVSMGEWEIAATDTFPVVVAKQDFEDQDIGLAQFLKAQGNGIAIFYAGWSRDGKTSRDPVPLQRSNRFNLNAYVGMQKKLARKGRCLHFDSGSRCDKIISAHSIQKNGQLAAIADKGHVYTVSKNIGTLKKNNGSQTLEKCGISKVSTFLGFCKTHDAQLFSPIDKSPLLPTGQQVLLYAYRSICRELFVKENALGLIESQLTGPPETSPGRRFFEALKAGTSFALENLRRHKADFDASLRNKTYADIEYTLFVSRKKPFLAFSGLFFPEFDFLGRHLQNLADQSRRLDLITICSTPMDSGWGFLFSWHKTSSKACAVFMRSLATVAFQSGNAADAMFRMVVSNCENLAVSPIWWEHMQKSKRGELSARLIHGANIFALTDPEYLTNGLEGICPWSFESVFTNVRKRRINEPRG